MSVLVTEKHYIEISFNLLMVCMQISDTRDPGISEFQTNIRKGDNKIIFLLASYNSLTM